MNHLARTSIACLPLLALGACAGELWPPDTGPPASIVDGGASGSRCEEIPDGCVPEGEYAPDWFCGPDPAPPASSGDCTVRPLRRKDGNHFGHDWCADAAPNYNLYYDPKLGPPGTRYAGADAVLGGKSFDCYHETYNDLGVLVSRYICEVKVGSWGRYCPEIQRRYLDRVLADARREQAIAAACGIEYVLFIADNDLYNQIRNNQLLPGVRLVWAQQCRA